MNGGSSAFAWELTVDAPGKPPSLALLAAGLVVLEGHGAGCCKVGSKHKAEFEEVLDVLEMLEVLGSVAIDVDSVVFVEIGSCVVVVFAGNVRMMVVETDRPGGTAGKVGKTKEYPPDGSGWTDMTSVYVEDPLVVAVKPPWHPLPPLPSILGGYTGLMVHSAADAKKGGVLLVVVVEMLEYS